MEGDGGDWWRQLTGILIVRSSSVEHDTLGLHDQIANDKQDVIIIVTESTSEIMIQYVESWWDASKSVLHYCGSGYNGGGRRRVTGGLGAVVVSAAGFSRFARESSAAKSSSRLRLLAAPMIDTPADVVAAEGGAPPRPGAAPRILMPLPTPRGAALPRPPLGIPSETAPLVGGFSPLAAAG